MKWLKDNLILVIVIAILAIGLIWELVISDLLQPQQEVNLSDPSNLNPTDDPFENSHDEPENPIVEKIYVDIKGEIYQPGVYLVNADDRVIDVIMSAGGFTAEADENQINLAERVYDEMVIYVPNQTEDYENHGPSDTNHDKIRINRANEAELQQLPGIGASKAKAIIQYREEFGLFKSAEELQNVPGIGAKTFANLAEYVMLP